MSEAIVHFLGSQSVVVILLLLGLFLFVVGLLGRIDTPIFKTTLRGWQRIICVILGGAMIALSAMASLPSRPDSVPVGTILLWWGSAEKASLPDGFEICDGKPADTIGATLKGNKPDLQGRFARGAESSVTDVRVGATHGGSDVVPALKARTGGTSLTPDQMPEHDHGGTTGGAGDHNHETSTSHQQNAVFGRGARRDVAIATAGGQIETQLTSTSGGHAHSIPKQGKGAPHDHEFVVPEHDNRPAYQQVFYIIKVK